jgi:hypothetical protein
MNNNLNFNLRIFLGFQENNPNYFSTFLNFFDFLNIKDWTKKKKNLGIYKFNNNLNFMNLVLLNQENQTIF